MVRLLDIRSNLCLLCSSTFLGFCSALFTIYLLGNFRTDSIGSTQIIRQPIVLDERPRDEVEVQTETEFEMAELLRQQIKICIWVMTFPDNHATKAKAVKDTWARRIDNLVFISTKEDASLPTVALNISDGRDYLWAKTKGAFEHMYLNYLDKCDWFMKADDDTFVVVENLRYMLTIYDPKVPIYFGKRFKPFNPQGYMSGGAGYVLSKAALILFVEKALSNGDQCKQSHDGAEDAEIGKCLYNVGVMAGDSRDDLGRGRFFPFIPDDHVYPTSMRNLEWYWNYNYYNETMGRKCCSDTAISFHYIGEKRMYELEYLIYELKPFGVARNPPFPPNLPPDRNSIPKEVLEAYPTQSAGNLL